MRLQVTASARALLLVLAATLAAGTAAGPAAARAGDLPARNQALLLLRVLAYDRNLKQRAQATVTVVVLYRPGDRGSEERSAALVSAFEEVARAAVVGGLPVKVESLPYRDAPELEARLRAVHPVLAYVDPGLTPAVPDIVKTSRRLGVLTADGSRALVEAGVAVAVVAQTDRAGLIVNLKASRQEGADFDSAMLALSDVMRD
jgi:hypothetical protein